MKALVLARGLGARMRRADPDATLTPAQRRAADAGFKALMPMGGRPFLDYVASRLADAGVRSIGLVVAPDHAEVARHYTAQPPRRLALSFVVQKDALGTANAVLAAEDWVAGEPFLAVNADNLYPAAALADLVSLEEPGLAAFDADDLVRSGNIPAERIRAFALIDVDARGYLRGILEKPDAATVLPPGEPRPARVSMNCWRFDTRIFAACRDVPRSPRGEYELPGAVSLAIRRGVHFRAVPARGPVLDLSQRADAAEVERRLAGTTPCP